MIMQNTTKRIHYAFIMFMLLATITTAQTKETEFSINHGPYLQELTKEGVTIVFTTTHKAYSWVELKKHDEPVTSAVRHYNTRDGLKEAWNTFSAIRIEGLQPATPYDYRIVTKEMTKFQPYHVQYGDSTATAWHTFSTTDPDQKGATLFVTSDTHFDSAKLENLLKAADYTTCDAIFYAGDMTSYIDNPEALFQALIDVSVKLFASSKPFDVVRGNHETRGNLARQYPHYFPRKDGHIYGSRLIGDVMIVMLDCGEDKQDTHPVYAGLTDFDTYRSQEAQWLKSVVKSPEYKKAKYRVIISHFPMVMGQEWKDEKAWHGWDDAIRKFLPILNGTKVDLMVSGHTHRTHLHEAGADGNDFPVLEQGYDTAVRIKLDQGKIEYTILGVDGPHGDTIRLK